MKLNKRVADLEAKGGSSVAIKSHIIGVGAGQTQEEAKDTYGREKIGPDDSIIISRSVAPRFDPEGDMIFHKDWPENKPPSS